MIRKAGSLFLCAVFGQLLYSCGSCFGDNTKALPYYTVKGYEVYNSYRVTGVDQSGNNQLQDLSENSVVDFDKLVISIQALVDYHAAAKPKALFLNSAFACSPLENGHKGTKETLDSLAITSYHDFDDKHPAGSNLTALFDVGGVRRFSSLSDYLAQDNLQAPQDIGLMLNTKPTVSQDQRFRITFYLSNGEIFSTESTALTIR